MTEGVSQLWLLVRPTLVASLRSLGPDFRDLLELVDVQQDLALEDVRRIALGGLERFDGWEDRDEIYAGLGLTFLTSLEDGRVGDDSAAVVEDLVRQVTAGAKAAEIDGAQEVREALLALLDPGSEPVDRDVVAALGMRLGAMAEALI
ncbi:MAG: hypothetical protein J7518_06405 [Nocardioidaceae bacterium]|nr:hypothetical protein [Nocardioidaceae bacterium]